MIIVASRGQRRHKTVKVGSAPPSRPSNGQFKLLDVYHHFAARKDRAADPQDWRRKCVVQAEWVTDCIRENSWLSHDRMDGWEIM